MPFKVTFTVSTEAQARELDAAWHEIVLGQRLPRAEAIEESTEAIMERTRPAVYLFDFSLATLSCPRSSAASSRARRSPSRALCRS